MSELKPCPFCGGNARLIIPHSGNKYVTCLSCYASQSPKVVGDVVHCWNTRATDPHTAAMEANLEECAREISRQGVRIAELETAIDGWINTSAAQDQEIYELKAEREKTHE